jgi:hypothetical protein
MEKSSDPLMTAMFHAGDAYRYLVEARTQQSSGVYHSYRLGAGIEKLKAAAEALGYDLVKREPKQEAA